MGQHKHNYYSLFVKETQQNQNHYSKSESNKNERQNYSIITRGIYL